MTKQYNFSLMLDREQMILNNPTPKTKFSFLYHDFLRERRRKEKEEEGRQNVLGNHVF